MEAGYDRAINSTNIAGSEKNTILRLFLRVLRSELLKVPNSANIASSEQSTTSLVGILCGAQYCGSDIMVDLKRCVRL